jgi:hypothetical protein
MLLCLGYNSVSFVGGNDVSEKHSDSVFRESRRGVLFNYVFPCHPRIYVCESEYGAFVE